MLKTIDVIVAGHLCLDLLPSMDSVQLNSLITPGRLYEVGSMRVSTGGAVSNTGLALHRLGVNTRLMSNIGDDEIGRLTSEFISQRDPVLMDFISVKQGRESSYTVVLSPEKVDRIFLHCTGPNRTFDASAINYAAVQNSRIFHLGYPPLLPALLVDNGEELVKLYRRVWPDTITSLDMTLPDSTTFSGQVDYRAILRRLLPFVDIFVPSIEEILFMLRRADFERWRGDATERVTAAYLDDLAQELFEMGHSAIVGFKLGEYGIYLCGASADRIDRLRRLPTNINDWSQRASWHPAFEVDVVGTTGAGDAAYAGLLTALLKGLPIDHAARIACAVGACCVERADATSGVRTWDETMTRLEAGWPLSQLQLRGR